MGFWLRCTPNTTPIGNELRPANIAAAQTMLSTTAVPGDVINCDGAWFTPGAAAVLTATRSFAAPGVTFIGNLAQTVQLVALGRTNMNIEFVNCYCSADALGVSTSSAYSIYFRNSSGFAVHGCMGVRGTMGIMIDNCTDYDVGYNLVAQMRDDGIRMQSSSTRGLVHHNRITDVLGQGRIYYDPVSGGTPDFWTFHGGTYVSEDVSHIDGISAFNVSDLTYADIGVLDNLINLWGQGIWMVDGHDIFNNVVVARNDITCALANAFALGDYNTNVEVSSNIVRQHPLPDPTWIRYNVYMKLPGGTSGWYTDGLNVFPVGTQELSDTSGTPLTAIDLNSGSPNGGGVPIVLNPSAFIKTTSNIANLDTLRTTVPAYTVYSGTPDPDPRFSPGIRGPGGGLSAYALNSYLTVRPQPVWGYFTDCEETYKTRWKVGASVVQGPTTGTTGMVYRAIAAGSVTAEIDYGDGVWVPSNTVTIS